MSKVDEIDTVSNESYPYISDATREGTSNNLMLFAHGIFAQCNKVKNIKELRKISKTIKITRGSDDSVNKRFELAAKWEKLSPVCEAIIDDIKIVTCFELYFKAKLLYNGFLVHLIKNNPKVKNLLRNQRERPVEISDYLAIDDYQVNLEKRHKYLPFLTKNTLGFGTLLSEEYSRVFLNEESEVLELLSEIKERRNRLHYIEAHHERVSTDEIDILIDFANRTLVKDILNKDDVETIKAFNIKYFG
jgi:hypothetical protein